MFAVMPKQKTPKPESDPPKPIFLRPDQPTADALAAYLSDQDVAPSSQSVLLAALHQFLEKRGYWPPPPPKK